MIQKEKMAWVIGILLLFVVVLLITMRRRENDMRSVEEIIYSSTLPLVVNAGAPYVVFPDGSRAKISFRNVGMDVRSPQYFVLGDAPMKMPVRLVRSGETSKVGVIKLRDSSVRTVVVDMATNQLHMRSDRVLGPADGSPFRETPEGDIEILDTSNRLGRVTLSLDSTTSTGHPGRVRFGSSSVETRRTIPSGDGHQRVGSADLVAGKHRIVVDLHTRRLLVQ